VCLKKVHKVLYIVHSF
jgi:hypothetical protein